MELPRCPSAQRALRLGVFARFGSPAGAGALVCALGAVLLVCLAARPLSPPRGCLTRLNTRMRHERLGEGGGGGSGGRIPVRRMSTNPDPAEERAIRSIVVLSLVSLSGKSDRRRVGNLPFSTTLSFVGGAAPPGARELHVCTFFFSRP